MKKLILLALLFSVFSVRSSAWAAENEGCPEGQVWSLMDSVCIIDPDLTSVKGRAANSQDISGVNPNSANANYTGVDAEADTNVNADLTTSSPINAKVNGGVSSSMQKAPTAEGIMNIT